MKTNVSVLAIAFVLSIALTGQARAQVIFSTDPIGIVGWNSRATDCRIVSGAALASLTTGSVTFRPGTHGSINLECQASTIMRVDPTAINALGLTFQNDNGFVGGSNPCTVSTTIGAYPYAAGLPILVAAFSTAGQAFSGRETANIPLTATLDYNNNMYLVGISLNRVNGATCNPIAVATFLEEVIQ
jgi:hypothetical protein